MKWKYQTSFPVLGIEREVAIGVEVRHAVIVAIGVGEWGAGRPKKETGFGVVSAGQPGGPAAHIDSVALPCFGTRIVLEL